MANYKLTQTGAQIQSDLNKVESILGDDNEFTGNNDFAADTETTVYGDLYIDGTITDHTASTGTDGQILSSTATGIAWISQPYTMTFDSSTSTLAITTPTSEE